jgi:hypothetical protein
VSGRISWGNVWECFESIVDADVGWGMGAIDSTSRSEHGVLVKRTYYKKVINTLCLKIVVRNLTQWGSWIDDATFSVV